VVYNHTCEGNYLGPTLSMRGVDNPAYYRLVESDLRYYRDYTGTGNSLNVRHRPEQDWEVQVCQYLTVFVNRDGIPDADARGQPVTGNSFLLCFNAHYTDIDVQLPATATGRNGPSCWTPRPASRPGCSASGPSTW
jgi:hypothetical protein